MKLALERVYEADSGKEAETLLEEWIVWARRSRIRPMIQLARTLDRHFWGIVAFARTQLTNAMVEGLNTKIKADKRRAYGFRSFANYRTIILLVCGGLKLQPTRSCYEPAGTRPTGCRTTPSFGEALTVARCWPTS